MYVHCRDVFEPTRVKISGCISVAQRPARSGPVQMAALLEGHWMDNIPLFLCVEPHGCVTMLPLACPLHTVPPPTEQKDAWTY